MIASSEPTAAANRKHTKHSASEVDDVDRVFFRKM
jgi:hypothetical protein